MPDRICRIILGGRSSDNDRVSLLPDRGDAHKLDFDIMIPCIDIRVGMMGDVMFYFPEVLFTPRG